MIMVVTLPSVPDCQTWNLQVDNYWMESLDYRYHKISINRHTASVNADGSVDAHRIERHWTRKLAEHRRSWKERSASDGWAVKIP